MPAPAALVEAQRQRLAALLERRGAPGGQYLVVRDGAVWLELVHGQADVLNGRPVTPASSFNTCSITKPFTAAAVLALAESGRLDLDAPIGSTAGLGGLQAYGSVRETLLHRAGLRNPLPLRWIYLAERHAHFDETAFVQARVAALRGTRRRWARHGYSNLGYLLLGEALVHAGAGPMPQALGTLVLAPLRAGPDEHLGFTIADDSAHAPGHLRRGGLADRLLGLMIDRTTFVLGQTRDWVQLRPHLIDGSAYGGLLANARGLARFGQALLGTAPGLSAAQRQGLLEPVPGAGPARSLGAFAGEFAGQRWFGHAGGGLGSYGELRVYPALGAVSVLLSNGPGLSDARCLDRLDRHWLAVDRR